MIIKKLTLHNFGIYASTNVFEFKGTKPIVLIGGLNGRGKTTFLEAVLLALYGSNSFAYNESEYRTYGQYLKSYVNTSDMTYQTSVELEFAMNSEEKELYRIIREWDGKKKRISEVVHVFKNGTYNEFLTDNWTMFIENILPSGLSNFFFFDGEKIASLAVEKTSDQMKESIKSLLGISVLDLLESDLGRIIRRAAKNQVEDSEAAELEGLRAEKDVLTDKLCLIDQSLTELENEKEKKHQKLEQKRQEYVAKGGDVVNQRQELFQKKATLQLKLDSIREQLIIDAATELPLVLVVEQLRSIREVAEVDQDHRMVEIALRKLRSFSESYEKINVQDRDAIDRFLNYMEEKTEERVQQRTHNLSDAALLRLQMLLDDQLLDTKLSVKTRQEEMKSLQNEIDQLESYLSVDIDEKAIAKIYKQMKEIEQTIIDLDVQISRKMDERRSCNGELMSTTSVFNKRVEAYLKKVELNDDSDRMAKYAHMANVILQEYKIRLQKKKISVVADTMTECYKKLANKKNLIETIEMDPVSLDLKYLNSLGESVNKESLSAGEKQLMVISLLWALALCSKKKLPVIIDTPLSRLDSAHRVSLIQTYFPQASEQTIILSTDSEIDHHYYELMKENIGDEFILIYDDQKKSTVVQRGYFQEVQ